MKEHMEKVNAILHSTDDSSHGIQIATIPNKGRGIIAEQDFLRGDLIVEYVGDLITDKEAKSR